MESIVNWAPLLHHYLSRNKLAACEWSIRGDGEKGTRRDILNPLLLSGCSFPLVLTSCHFMALVSVVL